MSNHFPTVAFERSKFPAPPKPLGLENAWKIINAVAYTHRADGWGLLRKTGGTQWNQCSVDVLINPRTHEAIDCLGDAEGAGRPQWAQIEYLSDFNSRWVAPTNGSEPPFPPTPPVPLPAVGGHTLVSQNKQFTLSMQDDGNLVIYRAGVAIWASGSITIS